MRALDILLLSDGRPGHYHLSEGVAAAIARRRPVHITRIELTRRRWMPSRAMAALLNLDIPAGRLLSLGYGIDAELLPRSDLVISAGGETLTANVAAARTLKASNIFCGTLRRVAPQAFSLVVSSYARHADRDRHLVALKPSGFDPDILGVRCPVPRTGRPPGLAGLLVGGDSGLFRYSLAEWRRLLAFLEQSHQAHATRWIVSTSRRSPDWLGDAFARLAASPDGPIQRFIDFRTAGPGTLPQVFAAAEAILCTEDSSTMMSEAVCARLACVGVSPARHAFKDEEREYRQFLCQENWCRYLPLQELGPESFLHALNEVRPVRDNHLERLADALADRLPELFRVGLKQAGDQPASRPQELIAFEQNLKWDGSPGE